MYIMRNLLPIPCRKNSKLNEAVRTNHDELFELFRRKKASSLHAIGLNDS